MTTNKFFQYTTPILVAVISLTSCRKEEKPAERKAPPVFQFERVEKPNTRPITPENRERAHVQKDLNEVRSKRRQFFEKEIGSYIREVNKSAPGSAEHEFAQASLKFLQFSEGQLKSASKMQPQSEINVTRAVLAKAESGLKNAKKRFDNLKTKDKSARDAELGKNPYYRHTPAISDGKQQPKLPAVER